MSAARIHDVRQDAMTDEQAEKMVRLLEEIRDGQRLSLQRQEQALQRQSELMSQQRERFAASSQRSAEAEQLFEKTAKIVARASVLAFVVVPVAAVCFFLLLWLVFARVVP
jgi:hypothetical protein